MPLSLGNLFRILVLGMLAVHVLAMYCLARTWGGEFGFHLGQCILAAIFALIMLVPLLWAVTVPEWPEIYARSFRSRRRWKQGLCPQCTYDMQGDSHDSSNICPECGSRFVEPEPYRFTWRIFRLFIVINLLAWLIGSGGGEFLIRADERSFQREVLTATSGSEDSLIRDRRWPSVGTMVWQRERGITTSSQQLP